MNLQSSFTYDNFGRRTSRTLQQDNNNIASAMKNIPEEDLLPWERKKGK